MPEKLEKALRLEAKKKGYGKERTDRYVYGTLRTLGYPVGRAAKKVKAAGRKMTRRKR